MKDFCERCGRRCGECQCPRFSWPAVRSILANSKAEREKSVEDPQVRIAQLEARVAELDAEVLAALRSGYISGYYRGVGKGALKKTFSEADLRSVQAAYLKERDSK